MSTLWTLRFQTSLCLHATTLTQSHSGTIFSKKRRLEAVTMSFDNAALLPEPHPRMEVPTKLSRAVPKYTKNTQAWWQKRTGWGEPEFIYRRAAVIRKLRERWPEKEMLNGHSLGPRREASDLLRPLVASWDDSSWSDPGIAGEALEKRLEQYTSWAFYLNNHFKLDENAPPALSTNLQYSTLNEEAKAARNDHAVPSRHGSEYWSETTSDEIRRRAESSTTNLVPKQEGASDPGSHCQWDDVGLQVDAKALGVGTVWLPMLDLKPFQRGQPAHWQDFESAKLYDVVSQEIGVRISASEHEFVYLSDAGSLHFSGPGGYKVMLKRFSQATFSPGNVLQLSVQPRDSHQPKLNAPMLTPVKRGKSFDLQQVTPQSRAKSRFTGSETDYSSDDSEDMERPTKRLKQLSTQETEETVDSSARTTKADHGDWTAVNRERELTLWEKEERNQPPPGRLGIVGSNKELPIALTNVYGRANVKHERAGT